MKYPATKKRIYTHGEGSLLDLHTQKKIWISSTIIGFYIEKRSNWDKGRSFRLKVAEIAEATRYSTRHVRRCLQQLAEVGWLKKVSKPGSEYLIFEIYPFDPSERAARQTTTAPLEDSMCPLSQLGAGKISRSECIAWHYANIGWQESLGETKPRSIREWASVIGLSAKKVWEVFKKSHLFQKVSSATHATVLRVFPFIKEEVETQPSRHVISEAEIQESHTEVVFKGEAAHYRGEVYRKIMIGFERWKEGTGWIFSSIGVPDEVKAAFASR